MVVTLCATTTRGITCSISVSLFSGISTASHTLDTYMACGFGMSNSGEVLKLRAAFENFC